MTGVITPKEFAQALGAKARDKGKDGEISNTFKDTYKRCFPSDFLEIQLTVYEERKIRKLTFEEKYIENPEFISPKKDRASISENDAEELGQIVDVEMLEKVVCYLHDSKEEIVDKFLQKTEEDMLEFIQLFPKNCKKDYFRTNNPEIQFMILLMGSLFQKFYDEYIHDTIRDYVDIYKSRIILSIPNRADEQYQEWKKEMFLEEEKGVSLGDAHVLPDYKEKDRQHLSMEKYLDSFIGNKNQKLSLILGGPGAGKSTLFTYMLNRENVCHRNENGIQVHEYQRKGNDQGKRIRLFRFSEMNPYIDWKQDIRQISERILKLMGLTNPKTDEYSQLKNSILLLDGFDECSASQDKRSSLLEFLAEEWGRDADIFITCRYHYVQNIKRLNKKISIIELENFDAEKIRRFISRYKKIEPEAAEIYLKKLLGDKYLKKEDSKKESKTNIYGIPIILYMVLFMWEDITIDSYSSVAQVYEQIFRENGGIYDHMAKGESYDRMIKRSNKHKKDGTVYSKEIWEKFKKHISWVSREIALYLFENNCYPNADKREIEEALDAKEIIFPERGRNQVELADILSSGTFIRYVDAPDREDGKIRFVHKTMYEYFMADYLYEVICGIYKETDLTKKGILSENALANTLKKVPLSAEICEFLQQKLVTSELQFSRFETIFMDMLNMGLFSYVDEETEKKTTREIRVRRREQDKHIFENMMYIVQTFRKATGNHTYGNKVHYLFEKNDFVMESFPEYLKMGHYAACIGENIEDKGKFDLSGINLMGMDLSNADLNRYDFSYCNAEKTSFRKSNLQGADFTGTILKGAAFTGANLIMTTPKAEELFDSEEKGIPWTEFTGYYPEQYVDEKGYTYEGQSVYKGATIKFGRYRQNRYDEKNGTPIEWKVLEVRGNRALLLSEKILDKKRYNERREVTYWKGCTLRKWLNGREEREFLAEANFSQKEREKICKTLVEPHKNIDPGYYETEQGKATEDQVFLLSGEEVAKYFALRMEDKGWYSMGGEQAIGRTTEYAHSKGLNQVGEAEWWWLRSVGVSGLYAVGVDNDGVVNTRGDIVYFDEVGVRPALWISLKS